MRRELKGCKTAGCPVHSEMKRGALGDKRDALERFRSSVAERFRVVLVHETCEQQGSSKLCEFPNFLYVQYCKSVAIS